MTQRTQFVEDFAQQIAESGVPRMAGRVLAHLATSHQDHLSLQELAGELGVSKASISTSTRLLIGLKMLRRVPVAGSRMEHYGLVPGGMDAALMAAAERARAIAALAARGQALTPDRIDPGRAFLREVEATYGLVADTLADVATGAHKVAR